MKRPPTLRNPLAVDSAEGFNLGVKLGGREKLLSVRQGNPQIAKFSESSVQFRVHDPRQCPFETRQPFAKDRC